MARQGVPCVFPVVLRHGVSYPTGIASAVARRRPPNSQLRTREHLTVHEVERLIEVARAHRYGERDALMVLLNYRHGLSILMQIAAWEQRGGREARPGIRREGHRARE